MVEALATNLHGVLPVLQTPYHDDGTVDMAALQSELVWIVAQQVSGITIGMVSDVLRLTTSERFEIASAVRHVTAEAGLTCVVSCAAESTRAALTIVRHAASIGADAVMVSAPSTFAGGERELHRYFAAVIEDAGAPVVVQDTGGYVGRPVPIDLMAQLLDVYGDRVYFKPESPPVGQRVSELRNATGGHARIFEGLAGAFLIDSYRRGVAGSMPGAEVCWAVQALWDALTCDDWERAYAIGGPLVALSLQQPNLDAFITVEKYLLRRQGVLPAGGVRGPVAFELDVESAAEVDRLIDRLRGAVSRGSGDAG